jgi:ATP-binding cassette subfamily B protein
MKYVVKHKLLVFTPAILMLISLSMEMLNPILAGIIIDRIVIGREFGIMSQVFGLMLILSLIRAAITYARTYLTEKLAENVGLDLRRQLFNHIQRLPFKFFDSVNTGELMSRMTGDIDSIREILAYGLIMFLENILYFFVAVAIMFSLNWQLAIVSVILMPFIAILAIKFEREAEDAYGKGSDQAAVLNTTAEENITGMRLVRAFTREKFEIEKFNKENNKSYETGLLLVNSWANRYPPIEMLGNMSAVLLLMAGGYFVIEGFITLGTLVAFNWYIWMIVWPMRSLGWLTNMLAMCNASAEKIFKILDTGSEIKDAEKPHPIKEIKGYVKFDKVSFSYQDKMVLCNISLDAKPGKVTAIMGATGAGKSSLISLIGRYYEAAKGQILIDGVDIKKIPLDVLRGSMGVAMQDTFLFSDTISENIAFGESNVDIESIIEAAKAAQAHEFIINTPNGYETVIGERGIGLSGGQKQRIALARALLKKPKILVLDDTTSSVDMETEGLIQEALAKNIGDYTSFIIAHRISSVRSADEIIILEDGKIIERGDHNTLLALKGKYHEIYMQQHKDFDEFVREVV